LAQAQNLVSRLALKGAFMPTESLADEVKKRSAWSMFMGVLTALLGCFLIAYPLATAAITTLMLGWVLIFVAITQIVFALHSQTVGRFFAKVLLAILYGVAGVVLAFFPAVGLPALTMMLGTLLLVYAGVEAGTAFEVRPVEGWGWFLFDAIVTFLVAMLILAKWPSSSIWAIGTLVGASVLMGGISRMMIALGIRSGVGRIERLTPKTA
jgi:uncharacterized membrane protein HdeD (DUF308 family)